MSSLIGDIVDCDDKSDEEGQIFLVFVIDVEDEGISYGDLSRDVADFLAFEGDVVVEAEDVALDFDLTHLGLDEITVMQRPEFFLHVGNLIAIFVIDQGFSDEERPEFVSDGVEEVSAHILDELLSCEGPELSFDVKNVFLVHVFDGGSTTQRNPFVSDADLHYVQPFLIVDSLYYVLSKNKKVTNMLKRYQLGKSTSLSLSF